MHSSRKILIVPFLGWKAEHTQSIIDGLNGADIQILIAEEQSKCVLVDAVFMVIGGEPNFALLRKIGEAARKAEVPIRYPNFCVQEIVSKIKELTAR